MRIVGFIWLEEVLDKIEIKHSVLPEEVEEVFESRPKIKENE